jgi:hypothetical protein
MGETEGPMSSPIVRPAREDDAPFIGWAILAATRSHMPRGWFDITLGLDEDGCLEFTSLLVRAETRSWWHYSNFLIAEILGAPAAALCAFRAGDGYPLSQAARLAEEKRSAEFERACGVPGLWCLRRAL